MIGDAEDTIAAYEGHSSELLRAILLGWWERLGGTKASGIVKLVMAEANNFPDLAEFYREEVIVRGTKVISSMLERAVARKEFRPLDIETSTQVLIAPMLMLMLWQHSFAPCARADLDPQRFLSSFADMALIGLQAK